MTKTPELNKLNYTEMRYSRRRYISPKFAILKMETLQRLLIINKDHVEQISDYKEHNQIKGK